MKTLQHYSGYQRSSLVFLRSYENKCAHYYPWKIWITHRAAKRINSFFTNDDSNTESWGVKGVQRQQESANFGTIWKKVGKHWQNYPLTFRDANMSFYPADRRAGMLAWSAIGGRLGSGSRAKVGIRLNQKHVLWWSRAVPFRAVASISSVILFFCFLLFFCFCIFFVFLSHVHFTMFYDIALLEL